MSKILRATHNVFGISAGGSEIGVFGSLFNGSPTYSNVIATIQSLPNWGSGWASADVATNRPALEDMNAFCYVHSYQLGYLLQMGIPEWDSLTVYYIGSIVQYNGVIYQSLQDGNTNHTPAVGAYWSLLSYVNLSTEQTVNGVKTFGTFPITPPGAPTLDYQTANKKYVDDHKSSIGAPSSRVVGVTYQAATDGFLVGSYIADPANFATSGYIASDASPSPTTQLVNFYWGSNMANNSCAFCVPIKKNDYYRAYNSAGGSFSPMNFISLGT